MVIELLSKEEIGRNHQSISMYINHMDFNELHNMRGESAKQREGRNEEKGEREKRKRW